MKIQAKGSSAYLLGRLGVHWMTSGGDMQVPTIHGRWQHWYTNVSMESLCIASNIVVRREVF